MKRLWVSDGKMTNAPVSRRLGIPLRLPSDAETHRDEKLLLCDPQMFGELLIAVHDDSAEDLAAVVIASHAPVEVPM